MHISRFSGNMYTGVYFSY